MWQIMIEKNVMVAMRDGVKLATDIYRQDNATPAPTLVTRTPYNKDGILGAFDIIRAVQAGYAVVVQDVRGRYASEGTFTAHFQEIDDGLDTLQWVAEQSWSNGDIGTFGGSYLGCTQWIPALRQPPMLRAMAPSITASDYYGGMEYHGGAKVLHDLRWVVVNIIPAEIERQIARGELPADFDYDLNLDTVFDQLPIANDPLIERFAPFYKEWVTHRTEDGYWDALSPCKHYEQVLVPSLNISGWYDIFLQDTFDNYMGMKARGGTEQARQNTRVIIGPWSHMNFSGSFPDREFGATASEQFIDLMGIQLQWFDRWLKEIDNGADREAPVMIFVMGIDQWRSESDWPLPDTQYRDYFLHSGGQANTLNGDGTLSSEAPTEELPDVFLYNPLRPVPTVGGQVILPGANAMGPRDQQEVELRDDVLVYSTPVLEQPIEVTGPIELRLFISSSARDTDFTGKLVDVFPDGRAIILTEGILRARYRNSLSEPELLEPHHVYELTLDLWSTSNVFLPGHRIRLEVSSSNFPASTATATQAETSQSKQLININQPSITFITIPRIYLA